MDINQCLANNANKKKNVCIFFFEKYQLIITLLAELLSIEYTGRASLDNKLLKNEVHENVYKNVNKLSAGMYFLAE
jgi:hypothetical protein